jgi:5-methylthioribose kinase
MVIKFSSRGISEKESGIFGSMPEHIRSHFVDFREHTPVGDRSFMVMPDLWEFKTFEECLYNGLVTTATLTQSVFETIRKIQSPVVEKTVTTRTDSLDLSRFFSLYLTNIAETLYELPHIFMDYNKWTFIPEKNEGLKVNNVFIMPALSSFRDIITRLDAFSSPITPFIHGDCHSRNIMVHPTSLAVKFIDIDQFQARGDYIYDFGVLLADLQVFGPLLNSRHFKIDVHDRTDFSFELDTQPTVEDAVRIIEARIEELAMGELKDSNWRARLALAKARYLFKMLKRLKEYDKRFAAYCEASKMLQSIVQKS